MAKPTTYRPVGTVWAPEPPKKKEESWAWVWGWLVLFALLLIGQCAG